MEIGRQNVSEPLVSIITVVYNSKELIEKTLQSIINQSYKNKELVVIDGASTDGTVQKIKEFGNEISYFISEKDKGIYDAMNKGLKAATGDYVIFINSGDLLEEEILSKIFQNRGNEADVFYGETNLIDNTGQLLGTRTELTTRKLPKKLTWKKMKYGMVVSHQSIFVKRSIAPYYELNYRCSADIEWVIHSLKKSKKIVNVNQVVSRYLVGGFSIANQKKCLQERYNIYLKYYGFISTIYAHIALLSKNLIHKLEGKKNY